MFDYAGLTTAELIDLLFKEEDRVTWKHIEELVRRGGEAALTLREILKNEDHWYEGQGGAYWIGLHAMVALSVMRDEKALPELVEMVPHLYFSNHDWAIEIVPAALAGFGELIIEPGVKFIEEYRGAYRDNPDYSNCRHDFSAALTMIALENRGVRQRIADFICRLFEDPGEDDQVFLSFSAAHPVVLDRERGTKALRLSSERGAIRESIVGKLNGFLKTLNKPDSETLRELKTKVADFYHPQAILERQRERAEAKPESLYWGPAAQTAPTGYSVSQVGTIVRDDKVGRNDPCPCGSGKKFKKCCGSAID
jgi:hypothetical protein